MLPRTYFESFGMMAKNLGEDQFLGRFSGQGNENRARNVIKNTISEIFS